MILNMIFVDWSLLIDRINNIIFMIIFKKTSPSIKFKNKLQ